jgi:hypothetical protein
MAMFWYCFPGAEVEEQPDSAQGCQQFNKNIPLTMHALRLTPGIYNCGKQGCFISG